MNAPTAESTPWYVSCPVEDRLILSPPGCGKTETLARWVTSVVGRGLVTRPALVLGLTFSNKAKANLRSRLSEELGSQWWRHARVMNFHGFAFHVYQHHASAIGRQPLDLAPQRGWQNRMTKSVVKDTSCDENELRLAIRTAKSGLFDEDEVMARLQESGHQGAIEYEERIRAEDRIDFDDVIRLGLLTISDPRVQKLYRSRFGALVVDEVQDLSRGQYELARGIGEGRTVFAGDQAQGIYTFAGAEPQWVFQQIRETGAAEVELQHSYRSSPSVLRAVSAIGQALGGPALTCATPDDWVSRGALRVLRFTDVNDEATTVVDRALEWCSQHPEESVAIIARTKPRRRWVDARVGELGCQAEVWDFPAHRPLIVGLLLRHADGLEDGTESEQVAHLYRRCSLDLDPADLDAIDELEEVFETINELLPEMPLSDIVAGIRLSSSPDAPVGPGLHLLNGHLGKGQEFSKVFVIGLEEAFIPHYFAMKSGDSRQIAEELSVLHVMASRAREELEVSLCDWVPTAKGFNQQREPSRWLKVIATVCDEEIDYR